jgi:hypothetical protein
MHLSQKAKKAVAAGLALSTILWSVSFLALPAAFAAPHSEGCLVNSGGTVYLVTGGQRRGFTSAEVFASHGYNFGQVVAANAEDVALPVGPIMVYADGSLVKGPNDPLVYLVANGQKRGFVSGSVFTGLGYSFANIQWAPVNTFQDLPTGANVESSTERHPGGTWVLDGSGTVWMMTSTGRKGVPSMEVFNSYGKSWAHVVSANASDVASANEGVLAARASCSGGTTPTGSVNVSLAGPASTTLIVDSTDGGAGNFSQAVAPLASFMFSGNGTVTSVTLVRTGVSTDAMLTNVYLFDGATRITDSGSFSSGSLTFVNSSGLFSVNGSKTISVKADLDDGAYAGQTVGVNMTAAALSAGSVGGLPVVGNTHTVAAAELATVAVGAPTDAGASDPGNDITVWQSTFTVGVRDAVLSRLALRQINNIVNSDVKNFRLLVDGVQVASTQSIDANGYVTFSGFSKTLTTGGRVIKVMADVIGGSSRTLEMSLRNKADVEVMDTQYGVNVSASGTFPADSDGVAINQGTATVVKASDSPSGDVTNNASGVKLGKWTVTAFGEPIKVENMDVAIDMGVIADADVTLRNGKLFVNGSQVGSTKPLVAAGAATSAANFTTNFTVNPGAPATVELYSDIYDEETGGDELAAANTIQAYLIDNDSNNATRLVSLAALDVPTGADVAGNQVTVTEGAMTLAATSSYANQTVVLPKTAFKIGSWTLTGSSVEDINLTSLSFDIDEVTGATLNEADLTSLYVVYGGNTSSIKSTASGDGQDNDWSINHTLAKNSVITIELFSNIAAGATATHSFSTDLTATGTGVQSNAAASQANKLAQTIIAGSGSLTEAIGAANPVNAVVHDNQTFVAAAFKWTAANENYTITELVFDIDGGATTVQNIIVKDGGTTIATRPGGTDDVTFSGLSIPVAANATKELTVELQLGTVGTGAGTMREDVKVQLESYKKQDSQGVVTQDTDDVTGESQLVFAAYPTVTKQALASVTPSNSEMEVYKFTVSANGGPVAVKQFGFKVTQTDVVGGANTLTLGDWKLMRDGADITSSVRIVDQGGTDAKTGGTALAEADTHVYVTFGSGAQGEEVINSSYTYTLRATPAGYTTPADDDSFKVEMLGDTATTDKFLNDADTTAAEIVASLSTAGLNAGVEALPQFLIWSDLSAVPHSPAIADEAADDPASLSSGDWTNGYLLKNLPMSAENFVY